MQPIDLRKKASNRLRRQYPREFAALCAILYQDDPIAINFGVNPDEYEIEAGMILPKLRGCTSIVDVHTVVYEEFVRGVGVGPAGAPERYRGIVERIWSELPGWFSQPRDLVDRLILRRIQA